MKRYLFPLEEWIVHVQMELQPFLGTATHYCNHNALVAATLNDLICEVKGVPPGSGYCFVNEVDLNGEPIFSYEAVSAREILQDYNIPTDHANVLLARLRTGLRGMIEYVLGPLDPQKDYAGSVCPLGDLEFLEHLNPPPIITTVESWKDEVRRGIENGDWYPESVRRLVEMH